MCENRFTAEVIFSREYSFQALSSLVEGELVLKEVTPDSAGAAGETEGCWRLLVGHLSGLLVIGHS